MKKETLVDKFLGMKQEEIRCQSEHTDRVAEHLLAHLPDDIPLQVARSFLRETQAGINFFKLRKPQVTGEMMVERFFRQLGAK